MPVLDQYFKPEYYFEQICRYPHGSYHEKPLSDYIADFAKERGLRYRQYDNFNVIIYKDAFKGYEDHEPVMLQGHIDMVCEKLPECDHDFEKDPIEIYVQDGKVKARGTTLGSDDGISAAYMLSILDDDRLPHPALECVFTVQEEVGCYGARDLDFGALRSKRMIGLDNMRFDSSDVTCSGSQKIFLSKKINKEENDDGFCLLKVQGLLGGHSAGYINAERANAIKLTARILNELNKETHISIACINGGDKDNAIPVYCETLFSAKLPYEEVNRKITSIFNSYKDEFADSDKDITVSVEKGEKEKTLSIKDSNDLLRYLLILPNGFRHRSMVIEGLTTASENLASIRTGDDEIKIRYFTRAALYSHLDEMADEITAICDLYGFSYELEEKCPGWNYVKDSPMRKKLFDVFEKHTGRKMKELATHGGLETAYIANGITGIDIACMGADCSDYHTVRESLDLKTFRAAYEILKDLLSQL